MRINEDAEVKISVREMGEIVASCTRRVLNASEILGDRALTNTLKELLFTYSADIMSEMFTEVDLEKEED